MKKVLKDAPPPGRHFPFGSTSLWKAMIASPTTDTKKDLPTGDGQDSDFSYGGQQVESS